MIVIRGGQVLSDVGWVSADVLVDGPEIVEVGEGLSVPAAEVIDARGSLVGPGFVDLHAHLREPGQTWKEDIVSGSTAAAAGGFTAVVAMPNTTPAIDDPRLVTEISARAREVGIVDVRPAGALTIGRMGGQLAGLEALYGAGVRIFTDDGDCLLAGELVIEAMTRIAALPGAVLAQHAEDVSMTGSGHMHDGPVARAVGVPGLPSEAEWAVVARDLALAERTGVSYHCQHVSAAETVGLIRDAKARGVRVTAEVAPHHLTFTEDSLRTLDANYKMYPPLRAAPDRAALRAGLLDRTIDLVATDHAPHAIAEKALGFSDAPRGVIGLETAASAVFEVCEDPSLLFEVLSIVPARIGGFARHGGTVSTGSPANLVVFDPRVSWIPEAFHSKSSNSPYTGREMRGRVSATIHEGELTHELEGAR